MSLRRVFRKLRRFLKKGALILGIYFVGLLIVLAMSERIERLEEKEQAQQLRQVAVKVEK